MRKANFDVLSPVCKLIKSRGLPCIDHLHEEVRDLFEIYTVPISYRLALEQGWAIRHLLALLKTTIRSESKGSPTIKRMPKDQCMFPFIV